MDSEKYNRQIGLMCPTCGSTQFKEADDDTHPESAIQCASCGRTTTKDELVRDNSENIEANLEEVKQEVAKDAAAELKKMLQDAFKGSKFIKVK